MIEFDEKLVNVFIATIRKYMQLRGDLNQKDLAEKLDIGIPAHRCHLFHKDGQACQRLHKETTS